MNSHTLLVANTRQTLRRFRALLGALVVGMALLVASAAVVGSQVVAGARTLDSDSSLTSIELLGVAPSGTPRELTPESLEEIRALQGAVEVVGAASVGVSLSDPQGGETGDTAFDGVFWAMPRFSWSQPPVVEAASGWSADNVLGPGQALLPSTYLGEDLSPLVGKTLTLEYTRRTGSQAGVPELMTIEVVGVFDNTDPKRDGDSALYLDVGDFERVYASLLGASDGRVPASGSYNAGWVKAASVADAERLAQELTDLGYYVNAGGGEANLPPALAVLQQVNAVIAVSLGLFGVGIGMTLAGTWSHLRRWDVGVLTSLGWSSREIMRTYLAELAIVGLAVGAVAAAVGTVLTVVTGVVAHETALLGSGPTPLLAWPPVTWLLGVVVAVPAALLLGAFVRVLRLSRTEPDDALRRID
ncbi:ABC transporter permease [Cellulomonas fimi]|uniref:ABC transporter permease n=1 Tax=Cellulomonas fimi TaxID=1708 RepID=A0A7Y0M0D0_CELFI|nr:ABC transporter permease [Cellulomonas fimi]NMR20743.1 ABC transporter permease [Cellulomonas fimi]